jgi:hypothetical protein
MLLILSLPTENATARMRAWRALKAQGAAVLRDGVYLMPARPGTRVGLQDVLSDVRDSGGAAYLLQAEGEDSAEFVSLFDRSAEFGELLANIHQARVALTADTLPDVLKQARKLRKAHAQLVAIDFFPGEAQKQAGAALLALETALSRLQSPDEPHSVARDAVERRSIAAYQGRTWATRARPWVDRLACAWLIRRYIDPQARLLWLASPAECPADALGFDFDGATFSHVGARVSVETLMDSFGLDTPALRRLGGLVHYLDAGGVQPPEASGIERLLAGLRDSISDDDQLLSTAGAVFDGLLAAFEKDAATP